MICKICGKEKKERFCVFCKKETPTFFSKTFKEEIQLTERVRSLYKSSEKINNKAKREIEQYIGNKDSEVVSEFERIRNLGKPTVVVHRLWRRIKNGFKKVHEHIK